MKLLVIVLCLLSERFLIHNSSYTRFHWFGDYCNTITKKLAKLPFLDNPWGVLVMIIAPLLIFAAVVLHLFASLLFGFILLLLHLVLFHYCLGPDNPFYPMRSVVNDEDTQEDVGTYLAQVNGQLFAVIFWYIALGPMAILAYRLVSLCQKQAEVQQEAVGLTGVLDWIPAKMTALLYLLAGNFQAGFRHFSRMFFTTPDNNQAMLSECGLQAVGYDEPREVFMPQAEILVEHAVIVLLVLLAFFTMAAWL